MAVDSPTPVVGDDVARTGAAGRRYNLTHLRALEAEAIFIMREAAAEFERPAADDVERSRLRSQTR